MFEKYKYLIFLLLSGSLTSCSTQYAVVKSNRVDYQITKEIGVDSGVVQTYLPYKLQLDAEMNTVIGYAEVALTKATPATESVLGNFFADAVLHQAKKLAPEIDFAVPTTKGGLRNEISKGAITVSNVFELMPFENELMLYTLKGADALAFLQFVAATNGQPIAGATMTINAGKADKILINGEPFDVRRNYNVLTSDYIAGGGDGAVGFAAPVAVKQLNLKIRDALFMEVKEVQAAGKKINAKLDGRITKN